MHVSQLLQKRSCCCCCPLQEVEGPGPDAAPDAIDQQAGGSGSEADACECSHTSVICECCVQIALCAWTYRNGVGRVSWEASSIVAGHTSFGCSIVAPVPTAADNRGGPGVSGCTGAGADSSRHCLCRHPCIHHYI